MEDIDIYDLEERVTIIGFKEGDPKEYGSINSLDKDRKLKYCARKIKPEQDKWGSLDIIFVLPTSIEAYVIEVRLLFDYHGEFKGDQLMQFTLQNIKKNENGRYHVYSDRFGRFKEVKNIGKNWSFKLGKLCYDKTIELYKELIKPSK